MEALRRKVAGAVVDAHKALEPARLGEGTGKMLYVWACRFAQGLGARELVIEADPDAAPFYRHMGAEPAGEAESGSIPGRFLPRLVHRL